MAHHIRNYSVLQNQKECWSESDRPFEECFAAMKCFVKIMMNSMPASDPDFSFIQLVAGDLSSKVKMRNASRLFIPTKPIFMVENVKVETFFLLVASLENEDMNSIYSNLKITDEIKIKPLLMKPFNNGVIHDLACFYDSLKEANRKSEEISKVSEFLCFADLLQSNGEMFNSLKLQDAESDFIKKDIKLIKTFLTDSEQNTGEINHLYCDLWKMKNGLTPESLVSLKSVSPWISGLSVRPLYKIHFDLQFSHVYLKLSDEVFIRLERMEILNLLSVLKREDVAAEKISQLLKAFVSVELKEISRFTIENTEEEKSFIFRFINDPLVADLLYNQFVSFLEFIGVHAKCLIYCAESKHHPTVQSSTFSLPIPALSYSIEMPSLPRSKLKAFSFTDLYGPLTKETIILALADQNVKQLFIAIMRKHQSEILFSHMKRLKEKSDSKAFCELKVIIKKLEAASRISQDSIDSLFDYEKIVIYREFLTLACEFNKLYTCHDDLEFDWTMIMASITHLFAMKARFKHNIDHLMSGKKDEKLKFFAKMLLTVRDVLGRLFTADSLDLADLFARKAQEIVSKQSKQDGLYYSLLLYDTEDDDMDSFVVYPLNTYNLPSFSSIEYLDLDFLAESTILSPGIDDLLELLSLKYANIACILNSFKKVHHFIRKAVILFSSLSRIGSMENINRCKFKYLCEKIYARLQRRVKSHSLRVELNGKDWVKLVKTCYSYSRLIKVRKFTEILLHSVKMTNSQRDLLALLMDIILDLKTVLLVLDSFVPEKSSFQLTDLHEKIRSDHLYEKLIKFEPAEAVIESLKSPDLMLNNDLMRVAEMLPGFKKQIIDGGFIIFTAIIKGKMLSHIIYPHCIMNLPARKVDIINMMNILEAYGIQAKLPEYFISTNQLFMEYPVLFRNLIGAKYSLFEEMFMLIKLNQGHIYSKIFLLIRDDCWNDDLEQLLLCHVELQVAIETFSLFARDQQSKDLFLDAIFTISLIIARQEDLDEESIPSLREADAKRISKILIDCKLNIADKESKPNVPKVLLGQIMKKLRDDFSSFDSIAEKVKKFLLLDRRYHINIKSFTVQRCNREKVDASEFIPILIESLVSEFGIILYLHGEYSILASSIVLLRQVYEFPTIDLAFLLEILNDFETSLLSLPCNDFVSLFIQCLLVQTDLESVFSMQSFALGDKQLCSPLIRYFLHLQMLKIMIYSQSNMIIIRKKLDFSDSIKTLYDIQFEGLQMKVVGTPYFLFTRNYKTLLLNEEMIYLDNFTLECIALFLQ